MFQQPHRRLLCLLLATTTLFGSGSHAFVQTKYVPTQKHCSSTTSLFLEDDIADMIDKELYRQQHLKDFENEWMKKNKDSVLRTLNNPNDDNNNNINEDELRYNFRQMQRDKKLAAKDPQAYCAERCITTGNCDVYEDIFDLSPQEVINFCSNCVLSDNDEPCEIPPGYWEVIDDIGYEKNSS